MRTHGVDGFAAGVSRGTSEARKPDKGPDQDRLRVNLRTFDKQFRYEIHSTTRRLIIRVIDTETSEVIREVPPEEVLDLTARMQDTAGFLLDLWM